MLTEDELLYVRSRLKRLEYGEMEKAIDQEQEAIEWQRTIILEVSYWSKVLSGIVPFPQYYHREVQNEEERAVQTDH